jgi:predicted dehydrogenase
VSRVRIGVVGAGLIAQVEHVPNLLALADRFELVAVAEPSAQVRGFLADRHGVAGVADAETLFELPLDAVLVATPDPLHCELVLAALERGLHVLCEKPLCLVPADCERVVAARDRADRVVQVGYMKRLDPAYEAAVAQLPAAGAGLRAVTVEVNDPDAWPFVAHHPHLRAADVPAALVSETRARAAAQARAALGGELDAVAEAGYLQALCSSLVHEVNAVHGLLDAMGVGAGEVTGAALFAGGDGAEGTVALDGGAVWRMMHLVVPRLAHYRERISVYLDDAIVELTFPSPWLNHQPTALHVYRSDGLQLDVRELTAGYAEAYLRELEAFHAAVTGRGPAVNPPEEALRDVRLLVALARRALGRA